MSKGDSLYEGYQLANWDIDDPSIVAYVGFVSRAGEWYIVRYLMVTKAAEYVRGEEDYAVNWAGRIGLTYAPFDEAF